MAQLIIKNIGPIKDVDITLNKVNVIIGPQSSGKSTINKIACYCTWVEKKVSLDQSFDFFLTGTNFLDRLVEFHKMKGYFRQESYIEFSSEVIKITYAYQADAIPTFEWVNQYGYQRTKISYIPAERNVVSLIAGWEEVKLPNNNIFNFMMDWNMARKAYTPAHSLLIDYIKGNYYYDEEAETDFFQMENRDKIQLTNASSGQQSMIPLYLLIRYFTQSIYEKKEDTNVKNKEREVNLIQQLFLHAFQSIKNNTSILKENESIQDFIETNLFNDNSSNSELTEKGARFLDSLSKSFSNFIDTKFTSLFIEEPELNLFPSTQRQLFYFILQAIQKGGHRLFVTTHSPYILYALNNCMMGALVKDEMPEEMAQTLESCQAWIAPELVSAWQIENGQLVSIQEEQTRNIGKHYFNRIMNDTLDEYYTMLNFFNPQKK